MARKQKPLPPLEWLRPRLAIARAISLGSFIGLILLLASWSLVFADSHATADTPQWPGLLLRLLPLLVVAPGVFSGNARGHAWACYVINLYFILGVLNAFVPGERIYGWTELGLSVVFFCAALLYTRWRFQYDRRLAGEQ
ncbi:MAG: hypothetical protein GAK45_00504 [Pseudomonas citronellolis]|nr:MAG: hypothetical protein GAK45_00504 [Pseudomonas citronellolis]